MPEQAAEELRDTGDFAGPFRVRAAAQGRPVGVSRPASHASAAPARAQAAVRQSFPVRPAPAPRSYVTARGALAAVFPLFLLSILIAGWLDLGIVTGLSYVAVCVLVPYVASRRALLQVVVAPPAIFVIALIVTQVLTAQGTSRHGRALSVLEGTALTLAATAPWLLIGTALCVVVAIRRGLIGCVRQLRSELRGERTSEPGTSA
jgi:hypothetical protein